MPPDIMAPFLEAAGLARDPSPTQEPLVPLLRALRDHLDMDVAFISEFAGNQQLFPLVVGSDEDRAKLSVPGDLQGSLCLRVTGGRLPELIPDSSVCPEAASLPVTQGFGIGAYLGVPIRFSDGSLYGTLCCVNHAPDPTLNARDVSFLRAFADIAARHLEAEMARRRRREEIDRGIQEVLEGEGLSIVYQPIYNVARHSVVGFEALSRFSAQPARTPDVWFAQAAQAGHGVALEMKAIELALRGLPHLPRDVYVSVNASYDTILSQDFERVLDRVPLDRVVLEITEHALIDQYEELVVARRKLRERGLRVAVDDAGAGYSSLRHILNLAPEKIKLDMSLIRDIDTHASKQAMAAALVAFAQKTGSCIIAEGVETQAELAVLRELGVEEAQGYLLGRPQPLSEAVKLCRVDVAAPRF